MGGGEYSHKETQAARRAEMHAVRIGNYGLGGKAESLGEKGEVSHSRLKAR